MFDDPRIAYKFIYCIYTAIIMAFAERLNNNLYRYSSHSMATPLFGSRAMENRQFGEFAPNNRDHLEIQQQQQQQEQRQPVNRERRLRKRRNYRDEMIFCGYCRNQMPPSCMAGKFF